MTARQTTDWPVTLLAPRPAIRVVATPVLAPDLNRDVARHWNDAIARRPTLYDGRIFCATDLALDAITGYWCPFSRALAQMRDPALFGASPLRPLAVTALLACADGFVVGQRAPDALYLPGRWQGVPAGSIESRDGSDEVDLRAQLEDEIAEELGLSGEDVNVGRGILACAHPQTHIIDIGLAAETALSFQDVKARWRRRGNAEYAQLALMDPTQATRDDFLPTTLAMYRALTA